MLDYLWKIIARGLGESLEASALPSGERAARWWFAVFAVFPIFWWFGVEWFVDKPDVWFRALPAVAFCATTLWAALTGARSLDRERTSRIKQLEDRVVESTSASSGAPRDP